MSGKVILLVEREASRRRKCNVKLERVHILIIIGNAKVTLNVGLEFIYLDLITFATNTQVRRKLQVFYFVLQIL